MSGELSEYAYGKIKIRVMKLNRHGEGTAGEKHDVHELTVKTLLYGDFADAWTVGSNSKIIATETQKNTVLQRAHTTNCSYSIWRIMCQTHCHEPNPKSGIPTSADKQLLVTRGFWEAHRCALSQLVQLGEEGADHAVGGPLGENRGFFVGEYYACLNTICCLLRYCIAFTNKCIGHDLWLIVTRIIYSDMKSTMKTQRTLSKLLTNSCCKRHAPTGCKPTPLTT